MSDIDIERTLLEYAINREGNKFIAMDSDGEVVGVYETEGEARQDVDQAKLEDAMYKHSKIVFHAAIASLMNAFDVDRDEARYWIATAAGCR
jgi:hypothetical protein